MAGNIYFKKGTKEEYNLLEVKDQNTIYFLTDTKEIYKGQDRYSSGDIVSLVKDGLMSIEDKESLNRVLEDIDNIKIDIININTDIDQINTNINKNFIYDVGFEVREDGNVLLSNKTKNIITGESSTLLKNVPVASSESNGLMTKEDVITLEQHTQKINALQGQTVRLLYDIKQNPTKQEIAQFVTDQGYTTNLDTIAVVIYGTYHIWHWYSNTQEWQDDGVDTVTQFTNNSPGIILGSNEDGEISANSNGTGKVNGFDDLKETVEQLSSDIEVLQGDTNEISETLNSTTTYLDTNRLLVSSGDNRLQVRTVNNKQYVSYYTVDRETGQIGNRFDSQIKPVSSSINGLMTSTQYNKLKSIIFNKISNLCVFTEAHNEINNLFFTVPAGTTWEELVKSNYNILVINGEVEPVPLFIIYYDEVNCGYYNSDIGDIDYYTLAFGSDEVIVHPSDIVHDVADGGYKLLID